jgi:hypothetical protein
VKICKVDGCNDKHYAKGYCSKHYSQWQRYGNILNRTKYDSNEIILHDDYAEIVIYNNECKEVAKVLIDLEDVERCKKYKWCLKGNGYVHNGKIHLHRFIMDCQDDMFVDHINRNKLDNRKCNLRICTRRQNNFNRGIRNDNTSGIIGVSFDKRRNKWRSRIQVDKKEKHLGYFNTVKEAIRARKQAELEYFGEYRNKKDEE